MKTITILSYAGCSTCKKALAASKSATYTLRAIVEQPPTRAELAQWIPASGLPIRKWLNTSGQSYRALGGKEHFDGLSDDAIAEALSADGKLVKRPVLVIEDGAKRVVQVGFQEATWATAIAT